MSSGLVSALRRPALRSNDSHSSDAGASTSASTSRSVLSAYSINSLSSPAKKQAHANAPDIRPDMLPFLKRQQLENLCTRVGLKASGKKADLIARLESYAADLGASTMEFSAKSRVDAGEIAEEGATRNSYESQAVMPADVDKENRASKSRMSEDDEEMGIPHEPASIRVIHSIRDSLDHQRRDSIARDTGAGIVLPSHGTQGSLVCGGGPSAAQGSYAPPSSGGSDQAQRSGPGPSLVPRMRSVTRGLSRIVSSQSIAATLRRPSVLYSENLPQAEVATAPVLSPQREKRKRDDNDREAAEAEPRGQGLAYATDAPDADEQPVRHVLSPQRVIKARPSRAATRKSAAPSTQTIIASQKQAESVAVPTRAFTFSMPHSPQAKAADEESTTSEDATHKVLAEMQARLARNGKSAQTSNESLRARMLSEQDYGQSISPLLPPSPMKSADSRSRGRFSTQHDKHFGQMDSIANHYAARRAAEAKKMLKAQNESSASFGHETPDTSADAAAGSSSAKRQRTDESNSAKSVIFSSPPEEASGRNEEERAAVRRKLEQARDRRKSGTSSAAAGIRRKSQSAMSANKRGPAIPIAGHGAGAFAQKLGSAMRVFMHSASTMRRDKQTAVDKATAVEAEQKPLPSIPPKPSMKQTSTSASSSRLMASRSAAKAKPVFDLQASLARKPKGYTPYSAKQTAEMLSAAAQKPLGTQLQVSASSSASKLNTSVSASKTDNTNVTPIRQGWQLVPTPEKGADSAVPFPKESVASPLPMSQRATPSKRAATAAGARKNRSSASQSARTSIRAQTVSRQIVPPSRKILVQRQASGAVPSGIARPRAIALRAHRSSSATSSTSAMATARMHQRRPSGVPRLNATPSKKKRQLLIPPRMPIAPQQSSASASSTSPQRRTVTTVVRSPRPRMPSPVRRVSGRGRGKPSVRPVVAGSNEVSSSDTASMNA